jgi:hypothetical protein
MSALEYNPSNLYMYESNLYQLGGAAVRFEEFAERRVRRAHLEYNTEAEGPQARTAHANKIK